MIRVLILALALTGCAGKPMAAYPPKADIVAVTEVKPVPSAAILTDPAESDRHNASVEAWGDRVRAAGVRLCRYFDRTGMPGLDCGE